MSTETSTSVIEERLRGIDRDREMAWTDQKRVNDKIFLSIEKLQNRPPVWATWIISVEALLIGLLAGLGLH